MSLYMFPNTVKIISGDDKYKRLIKLRPSADINYLAVVDIYNNIKFKIERNATNCSGLYLHNMIISKNIGSPSEELKMFNEFLHILTSDEYYSFQFSVNPYQYNKGWKYLKDVNDNWIIVNSKRRGARGYNKYYTLGITKKWKK